ncbi:MAG: hypothetical protein KTR27_14430 [Leptolyngbyaceae cyanobacterium MAG.088]|nr:hypothetical protein [Leptolyngbyaceae cyanobacterium MAG.088]
MHQQSCLIGNDLQNFKLTFPVYRDDHIYGAVAGIEIDAGADRDAYK